MYASTMPYGRYARRRWGRPRRRYGKKYVKKRNYKLKRLNTFKTYHYSRYGLRQSINLVSNQQLGAYQFSLDQVQNFADFTQLYDQYKITGVKVIFRLMTNPDSAVATTQIFPTLWMVRDNDDSATPGSLVSLMEKEGVKYKVLRPNSAVSMYIKSPRLAGMVYQSGTTTSYTSIAPKWVDCSYPTTPHYAIKWCVDSEGVSQPGDYYISVQTKYYLTFRGAQ